MYTQAMSKLRIPSPVSKDAHLTRKQAVYLAAIQAAGGIGTVETLAKAAGCGASTVRGWRVADQRFVTAEQETWRRALFDSVPEAFQALRRLLRADLDHGAKGLAATDRAVRMVLEGVGIQTNSYQPALRVSAALRVEAPATVEHQQSSPVAQAGAILDAEWS
jgi:hypothetical protein